MKSKRYILVMGGFESGWSRHNDEGVFRDYEAEANRFVKSADIWDLEVYKFNNDYIYKSEFYPAYKEVLDKTSFGFAFKPIIFWKMLQQVNDGDLLLFVDSNHVVDKDPSIFYEIMDEYGFFVHNHIWVDYPNKNWTRRDTFINMGCDNERYWEALQMQGNIIGIKKHEKGLRFVTEWLSCSLNADIMFPKGKYPNFEGFKEHRHDQSLFSILVEKYEIPHVNRTQNVWMEYVIPEIETITPKNPVDNSYRREQDLKDIR